MSKIIICDVKFKFEIKNFKIHIEGNENWCWWWLYWICLLKFLQFFPPEMALYSIKLQNSAPQWFLCLAWDFAIINHRESKSFRPIPADSKCGEQKSPIWTLPYKDEGPPPISCSTIKWRQPPDWTPTIRKVPLETQSKDSHTATHCGPPNDQSTTR